VLNVRLLSTLLLNVILLSVVKMTVVVLIVFYAVSHFSLTICCGLNIKNESDTLSKYCTDNLLTFFIKRLVSLLETYLSAAQKWSSLEKDWVKIIFTESSPGDDVIKLILGVYFLTLFVRWIVS